MKKKTAILLSGRGSNMIALVEAAGAPDCPYTVALVASDKPDAAGIAWAQDAGRVLATAHDAANARRLQSALRTLLRKG